MGKLYGAAPIDEIKLKFTADKYVSSLNGELPTENYLQEITREHDADLAAMIFYSSIIQVANNLNFIKTVDDFNINKSYPKPKIKLNENGTLNGAKATRILWVKWDPLVDRPKGGSWPMRHTPH